MDTDFPETDESKERNKGWLLAVRSGIKSKRVIYGARVLILVGGYSWTFGKRHPSAEITRRRAVLH